MKESELNMPPLPEFGDHGCIVFRGKVDKRYSEDQMRAYALDYARAAVLKEREACAAVAANIGKPVGAGDGCTYVPGTSAQAAAAIRNRT